MTQLRKLIRTQRIILARDLSRVYTDMQMTILAASIEFKQNCHYWSFLRKNVRRIV
jgi:hypothetical protein